MKVIIKTGFLTIKHSIIFQPETMPKGKKLVEANHVFNVEERRENGNIVIQAHVIRQTSVTSTPYKVQFNINGSREVTRVSCNCVYNKSKKCKHVAALIYYINNQDSLSKTDFEQQWGKPTSHQLAKEQYAKGKYFYEMFGCPPKKRTLESCPVELSKLKDSSALKVILAKSNVDKNENAVKTFMLSILDDVEVLLKKEACEACVENLIIFSSEHEIYSCNCEFKNESIKQFYNKEIVMSEEAIIELTCNTMNQSKCKDWFSARQCRISASSNCHKIKTHKKKSVYSLVADMLSPKTINASSLQYGIVKESIARQCYMQLFNCEVIELGVFVNKAQPWLCASLDGVVLEDCCITKVLEIKCPISCSNKVIVNFEKHECNVKYLQFEGSEVILKKNSLYYSQVQVQMYVSGLSVCDLFIYSPVNDGSFCVKVYRDESFLEMIILSCEQFYFEHYLLALYASNQKKNIKINEEPNRQFTGKNICNQIL